MLSFAHQLQFLDYIESNLKDISLKTYQSLKKPLKQMMGLLKLMTYKSLKMQPISGISCR